MITCQICQKQFKFINNTHLKSHNLSAQEYLKNFPGSKLVSDETSKKYSANSKKQNAIRDYSGIGAKISETKKRKFAAGELVQWNKGRDETKKKKAFQSIINKQAKSDLNAQRNTLKLQKKELLILQADKIFNCRLLAVDDILLESKLVLLGDKQSVIRRLCNQIEIHCLECNNVQVHTRQMIDPSKIKTLKCRTCNPVPLTSTAQLEVFNFIKTLCKNVKLNDREILGGREIDIYLPEEKIGFEYNGLYWHSESIRGEPKHLLWKQQHAFKRGITLYNIFEDEWIYKQDIVKSRIKQILNQQDLKSDARKCKLELITSAQANMFLSENHLQGVDFAGVRYCLKKEEEILALMTFKKTSFVKGRDGSGWELSRFAIKKGWTIRGAASRLLTAFERDLKPIQLLTYADRRWSFGKVYHALGFKFQHFTMPGYWYIPLGSCERLHRSRFMKHLLIKDGADPAMTEREIMQCRGYDRIWDCGNLVFIKDYNS
jgi:hypothetical protein